MKPKINVLTGHVDTALQRPYLSMSAEMQFSVSQAAAPGSEDFFSNFDFNSTLFYPNEHAVPSTKNALRLEDLMSTTEIPPLVSKDKSLVVATSDMYDTSGPSTSIASATTSISSSTSGIKKNNQSKPKWQIPTKNMPPLTKKRKFSDSNAAASKKYSSLGSAPLPTFNSLAYRPIHSTHATKDHLVAPHELSRLLTLPPILRPLSPRVRMWYPIFNGLAPIPQFSAPNSASATNSIPGSTWAIAESAEGGSDPLSLANLDYASTSPRSIENNSAITAPYKTYIEPAECVPPVPAIPKEPAKPRSEDPIDLLNVLTDFELSDSGAAIVAPQKRDPIICSDCTLKLKIAEVLEQSPPPISQDYQGCSQVRIALANGVPALPETKQNNIRTSGFHLPPPLENRWPRHPKHTGRVPSPLPSVR